MADCIFCKIINKEVPAHIVWENERFIAMLDVRPVSPGHLLIIPKEHVEVVFDLKDDLYGEIFNIARTLARPLQDAMGSAKIGILIEGFGVPHTHLHLIPINRPHDLNSENARPMNDEELNGIAEKIKQKIKN
jgi:histidine triad (HIT) family protein